VRVALTLLLAAMSIAGCESAELRLTLGDQCDLDSQCEAPLVCRLARCRLECATTRDCPVGQLCAKDSEGLGACLLADEATCELDSDCPDPLVCLGGGCTNECRVDRDCAPGARCVADSDGNRFCEDPADTRCRVDSECAPGICAVDGVCRDQCRTSRDCRAGTVCSGGVCMAGSDPDGGAPDAGADAGPTDAGAPVDAGPGDDDAGTMDGGVGGDCSAPADCVAAGVATADCVSGACVVLSCEDGLGDCDGSFATGCETPTATNPDDCGTCGRSCGAWGACWAGVCDGVVAMAIGDSHACFVRGSGLVLCMGSNNGGALGIRSTEREHLDPSPVYMLADGEAVSAGRFSTCVRRRDDTLACFGSNSHGQLGDGTFTSRSSPVTPIVIDTVVSHAFGDLVGCAVDTTGQVFCQGHGTCGHSGLGLGDTRATPTAVPGVDDALQVAAMQRHTCVVRTGGTVSCWGLNWSGELGDGVMDHGADCGGTTDVSATPVDVPGTSNAIQVGVGDRWSCALLSDGTVSCWGMNNGGWGAAHATETESHSPLPVIGVTDGMQIAVDDDHACVVEGDGHVRCWGANDAGQLGAGDLDSHDESVEAVGVTDAVAVETGPQKTCALRVTGGVVCWGDSD